MDCCQFRERYSDFADGLLPEPDAFLARQHLALCRACRRFDAAFRAGVDALRALPSVGVSRGFGERLRRRLRRELAVHAPRINQWSGAVGALLVVATVGFIGWDLVESHGRAARRPTGEASRAAVMTAGAGAAALQFRHDTAAPSRDPFHPLRPMMIIADTHSALYADHLRFDVPAVWGGR